MTAAHTPGPWILATVPTSAGSCHKIGPFPNGSRVATFACVYADGHRLGIDDDLPAAKELSANARLIAAAPDLLAALQWVMSATGEQLTSAFEAAQDAISKATGGQS